MFFEKRRTLFPKGVCLVKTVNIFQCLVNVCQYLSIYSKLVNMNCYAIETIPQRYNINRLQPYIHTVSIYIYTYIPCIYMYTHVSLHIYMYRFIFIFYIYIHVSVCMILSIILPTFGFLLPKSDRSCSSRQRMTLWPCDTESSNILQKD